MRRIIFLLVLAGAACSAGAAVETVQLTEAAVVHSNGCVFIDLPVPNDAVFEATLAFSTSSTCPAAIAVRSIVLDHERQVDFMVVNGDFTMNTVDATLAIGDAQAAGEQTVQLVLVPEYFDCEGTVALVEDNSVFATLSLFNYPDDPSKANGFATRSSGVRNEAVQQESRTVDAVSTAVFPNPFNPTLDIAFSCPKRGAVTVDIYDLRGRLVQRIADGVFNRGTHEVQWRGTHSDGSPAPSGVYFVRMNVVGSTATRKVVLAK